MSESRITRQRRIFAEAMALSDYVSFTQLKETLVGQWSDKMDITTLYRIADLFIKQHFIHEILINGERNFFLCKAEKISEHDAVTITFCENCHHITDEHTPIDANIISSYTEKRLKTCNHCQK